MDLYNKLKSKVTGSSNDRSVPSSSVEKEEDTEGPLESICLLFPTYATRNLEGNETNEWNIRVRGWAFSAPKKSKTRSLFLGLTSLALQKDDERYQYLESRTSYFWAHNISQGEFTVQVDGLTEPSKMSIEGDPFDDDDITTREVDTSASPDVKKRQTPRTIPIPENEVTSTKITPQSGHFYGDLSLPKQTVVNLNDKDVSRVLKVKVHRDGAETHYGVVNLIDPEGVSIISDIDDTIKDTDILRGAKKVLSNTFLQPFKDVPGMADLYRSFYEHGASVHYVSNSPWQLFPSLRSFFQTYNFPPGSAHFKFYDGLIKSAYEQKENPMASKFMYIRELLKDFPNRKFVLIGDTGELDPEIYTTVARENPGRILRIYVRDVTTDHVKDLPPAKPKHSYTRTFPTIYNYLRNHYSSEEQTIEEQTQSPEEKKEEAVVTGKETTSEEPNKPGRQQSTSNKLLNKLHVDVSYLYGTALDSPDSTSSDSSKPSTTKPKTPLSAKLLSPSRAAAISSKFSKLRHFRSDNKDKTEDKTDDGKLPEDVDYDDDDDDKDNNEVLKTPLEMFHERIRLLGEGLPDGLFHTFTDAKEIENDPAIREALKY